jgi:hypothetical protein
MLPEAKRDDLLYVSDGVSTFAYSYPQGKLMGSVAGGLYLCSDLHGDVFVPRYDRNDVLEYAHGGSTPIATLSDPALPWGCSVDPVTGNLAVANMYGPNGPGNIAIFPKAQNPPQIYADPNISHYVYCGYDNHGNLFVDGAGSSKSGLAELAVGSATFEDITLNHPVYSSSVIQWDGSYITIADAPSHEIDRIQFSGPNGTIVGQTRLRDWHQGTFKEIWLQGNHAIAQPGKNGEVGVWQYPKGSHPKLRIGALGRDVIYGVTVSLAQSR